MNGSRRVRLASWWAWFTLPWRSWVLAVALVAAFAVPPLMVASRSWFETSAADAITVEVLADQPEAGVSLTADGTIEAEALGALDDEVRREFGAIDGLGEVTQTVVLPQLGLAVVADVAGEAPAVEIGSAGRVLSRVGAIDALEVVAGDRSTRGLWISERVAERIGIGPGDVVMLEGAEISVPIAGVYANLWEGEVDPYWDTVPPELVPRFIRAFSGPNFELFIVDLDVLTEMALFGTARWDADLVDPPDTLAGLTQLTASYRGVERAYTARRSLSDAVRGFSGVDGPVPSLRTEAFDSRRLAEELADSVRQPVAMTAAGGGFMGVAVAGAGAAFAVRRRRQEMWLLRADGDAAWRFGLRAVIQYAVPALVGAALGVATAWFVVRALGPSSSVGFDSVDLRSVALVSGAGLLVAGLVTALTVVRLDEGRTRPAAIGGGALLLVVGVAAAAWVQMGSATRRGEVDALVVAFPVVGTVAGVGVALVAARWLLRRFRRTGAWLPTSAFLAWRRVVAGEASSATLAGAVGMALGLMTFTSVLVDSLDRATSAKTATVVGGWTQARMQSPVEILPAQSTMLLTQNVSLTVGSQSVSVIVVDPDTYADGVTHHELFGASADEVIDLLASPVDEDLAAVVVGDALPTSGALELSPVMEFSVVERVASVPLASDVRPTMLVSADQIDAAARQVHELTRPPETSIEEWDETYRSPVRRFQRYLVTQLSEERLTEYLDENDLEARSMITQEGGLDDLDRTVARWTFEYLQLLAVVAGVTAVGALGFYLDERRNQRRVSSVMGAKMGLRPGAAAAAAVLEVLALVVVSLAAATAVALVLTRRALVRFDPDPDLPPTVGLQVSGPLVGSLIAGSLTIVVLASLITQRRARRDSYAEALRAS